MTSISNEPGCAGFMGGAPLGEHPPTLPGVWQELGGLDDLVRLDTPAVTAGMVVVARRIEDWRHRPELRFQVWPEDLLRASP